MFCPKCGGGNDDEAKFCENCGARLDDIFPVKEETETEKPSEELSEEALQLEEQLAGLNAEDIREDLEDQTEELDVEFLSRFDDIDVDDEPDEKPRNRWQEEQVIRPSQRKKEEQEQSDENGDIKNPEADTEVCNGKVRGITKIQLVVIAEVIVLVLIITGFFVIGNSRNNAASVAKRYAQAYADHDWEAVYDLMDRPEGALLQKTQFVETMEATRTPSIQTFKVTPDMASFSKKEKRFYIQYTIDDQGTDNNMELDLVKQSDKSMFFFDKWRVSPKTTLVTGYNINVPKGASVAVDGIKLEDGEKTEPLEEGMDTYSVALFSGTHTIQAAVPWYEIYKAEFTAYQGDQCTVSRLTMTDDGKTAIKGKMQKALKQMYEAAMSKDDFSTIEDLFTEGARDACRQSYDSLVSNLQNSGATLNTVSFDTFECNIYDGEDYSPAGVRATLSYRYNTGYTYQYYGWGGYYSGSGDQTGTGNASMEATFVYSGGTYKVSAINISSVL